MTIALGGSTAQLTDRDWPAETGSIPGGVRTTLSEAETEQRGAGEIVVTGEHEPASWFFLTANALWQLLSLPENWDTYGARCVARAYVEAVLNLMWQVMQDETPPPTVVPTPRGGVQLEWHTRGIDLEVEFVSPTRVRGIYEDLRSGRAWEAELTFDLSPLADAIAQLTERC